MVSLDLVLHDAQGHLIHSSDAPVIYLHSCTVVALRPASAAEIERGAVDDGAEAQES